MSHQNKKWNARVKKEAIIQPLELATKRLHRESSICAAFLHGSAAKGCLRPESDIDIAILPMPRTKISLMDRLSLAGELELILRRPVDLGVLSTSNLIYVKEVIEHGELLFTKDSFLSDRFTATALSMYADLQQDRKEVLHAYSI